MNSKLPGYNPKNGGKSSVVFGEEKNEFNSSGKVRNPPGGRSNIQFG